MESFYLIVIAVATLALILLLTYVGLLMTYYKDKDTTYPPVAASCPDLWKVSENNNNKCVIPPYGIRDGGKRKKHPNVGNIYYMPGLTPSNTKGVSRDGTIDFSHPGGGKSGNTVCAKQVWANSRGIVWDGITNYNAC
jgi:hypothetical protein